MKGKRVVRIEGMHCSSCELLVEKNIGSIPGVTSVRASRKRGLAEITYSGREPGAQEIERAVEDSGYRVGESAGKTPWISRSASDYYELVMALGIGFMLFVALSMAGAFELDFSFGSKPELPVVALVGLAAGISTCMALVGGLVLGITARNSEMHPEQTRVQKIMPSVYFNLGRVLSFFVLGGVIGLLGSVITLSNVVLGMLIALAGGTMAWLGLKLIGIFPKLDDMSVSLPPSLARALGLGREGTSRGSLVTGALTFFLPCGFTQAMQIYAISTGSFLEGALIMSLFAVGTIPGLLGAGAIASAFKGLWAKVFFKFVGATIILFGIFNLQNGITLAGFDVGSDSSPAPSAVAAKDGVQIIRMDQLGNGYSPNRFTVKKGVPVRWVITSKNPYTCAAYLYVPSLNVRKFLETGENVIEFTPDKAGKIGFSCSMGMYSGSITVVD